MAHKTVEQLGREIESFQEDIRKLQKELGDMTRFTISEGREKLKETGSRLRSSVSGLSSDAGQKAHNAYEAVCRQGSAAMDKSRSTIGQRPVTAVLIAFAAGMLLSRLFGRNHS